MKNPLMNSAIISEANDALIEWSKEKNKLIVGIDGYPGSGKTTLATELAKINPNVLVVSRDDFIIERDKFQKLLDTAEDKSLPFEYDIIDQNLFQSFLNTYKTSSGTYKHLAYTGMTGKLEVPKKYDLSKPILIIEGVFLFHPKLNDQAFDRRIFLVGNKDFIRDRRVAREKSRWGDNYMPEDHPDSYFRLAMVAFDRYEKLYKPEERADLVVGTTL